MHQVREYLSVLNKASRTCGKRREMGMGPDVIAICIDAFAREQC